MVGSSLLLAAALVVRYPRPARSGETAAMPLPRAMWYARPVDIRRVGVDGISVAMLLSAVIVFTGTFASWRMQTQVKEYFSGSAC